VLAAVLGEARGAASRSQPSAAASAIATKSPVGEPNKFFIVIIMLAI
jgi:hypothetical protein